MKPGSATTEQEEPPNEYKFAEISECKLSFENTR